MKETEIDLVPTNLVTIITETGLEINSSTSQLIKDKFEPFIKEMDEWKDKAEGLVVNDITEKDKMREARVARLALRAIRVDADKVRKALKEDSNKYNKAVQSIYNFIEGRIAPLEEHLEQQERFEEVQLKKEREALKEERLKLFAQYSNDGELFNLGELSQESFDSLYGTIKQAHEVKIAAEIKAIGEAQVKAKLESEEREKQRAEIEQLKAELKAKQDAEDKANAEAEKQQKLQEQQKNSESIASDKQKMLMFAKELTEIKFPALKRKDSQAIIDNAKTLVDKVIKYVDENTTKLK